ncbi:hypothetical protein SEVIR_2G171050v4 [Setaria viridis]
MMPPRLRWRKPHSSVLDGGRLVGAAAVAAGGVPAQLQRRPHAAVHRNHTTPPCLLLRPYLSHMACILSIDPDDAILSFLWLRLSPPQDLGDGDGTCSDRSALEVAEVTSQPMAELLEIGNQPNRFILVQDPVWDLTAALRILPRPISRASAEHSPSTTSLPTLRCSLGHRRLVHVCFAAGEVRHQLCCLGHGAPGGASRRVALVQVAGGCVPRLRIHNHKQKSILLMVPTSSTPRKTRSQ